MSSTLSLLQSKTNHIKTIYRDMGSKKQSNSPRWQENMKEIIEKDVIVCAYYDKEEEWKQERKRLREEVKRLRKVVEEKEERIRVLEDQSGMINLVGEKKKKKEWEVMRLFMEERDWRDEAVVKWKKLFLAIKKELDDLIQGGVYWGAESEDLMKELKRKLEGREETIKALKMKLASVEYEGYKSKREVDILRQSLRIMSHKNNNKPTTPNNIVKWK